jgi:hypothetical protein
MDTLPVLVVFDDQESLEILFSQIRQVLWQEEASVMIQCRLLRCGLSGAVLEPCGKARGSVCKGVWAVMLC